MPSPIDSPGSWFCSDADARDWEHGGHAGQAVRGELAGHAPTEPAQDGEHARRGRARQLQGEVGERLADPRPGPLQRRRHDELR